MKKSIVRKAIQKEGAMARSASYPAIECVQNGTKFYSTVIESSVLKETCFVTRRDDDPEKGFQRLLNKNRAKDIAKYLDDGKGVVPSAIILSAQDQSKLIYDKNESRILFSVVKDAFLVIDGQHRLYGYNNSIKNYQVPVIIFDKLTTSAEVSLFIDINTTQKGVPSALLLDIKQIAGKESKREERQRELFNKLNEESPLTGLLSASQSVRGKISRSAFNEATSIIFEAGPLSDQSAENIYKGVRNFLEATEYVFNASKSENARLSKTVLFKSLFMIINEVLNRCLQEKGNLKTESIVDIIEPLSTLPFDDYTGTNKATINRIVNDMRSEINKYEAVNEDMF